MEKLQRLFLRIIAIIGVAFFLFLTAYSCLYTKRQYLEGESIYSEKDNVGIKVLVLLLILLFAFIVSKLAEHVSDKVLRVIAILVSCAMAVFCVTIAVNGNLYPYGDQECVYTAAVELYTGEYYKLLDDWYYEAYPFQLGLAQIYAFWFRITGGYSVFRLQCFQAILTGISVFAGYQITGELFHKKEIRLFYLISIACFFPVYLYTNYIYGETWSLTCSMLAIYCFLLANKEWKEKYAYLVFWALTGLFLTAIMIARVALCIVGIAIIITQFLICLRKKKILPLFLSVFCLLMAFGGYKEIKIASEREIGRNLGEGAPASVWIAMGLQDDDWYDLGPGSNNSYNLRVFMECNFETDTANKVAMQNIKETLENWRDNPQLVIPFFKEKLLYQWIEPSYGSFYMTRCMEDEHADWIENLYFGEAHDVIYNLLNQYQSVIYTAMLIYFVSLLLQKREIPEYLPGLIVLGGLMYTMVWESKNRYVYPYIVLAMPCIAMGVAQMEVCAKEIAVRVWRKLKKSA